MCVAMDDSVRWEVNTDMYGYMHKYTMSEELAASKLSMAWAVAT